MDTIVMQERLRQWVPLFEAQAQSGLTKADWCKANGIKEWEFFRWQRLLRQVILSEETTIVNDTSGSTDPEQSDDDQIQPKFQDQTPVVAETQFVEIPIIMHSDDDHSIPESGGQSPHDSDEIHDTLSGSDALEGTCNLDGLNGAEELKRSEMLESPAVHKVKPDISAFPMEQGGKNANALLMKCITTASNKPSVPIVSSSQSSKVKVTPSVSAAARKLPPAAALHQITDVAPASQKAPPVKIPSMKISCKDVTIELNASMNEAAFAALLRVIRHVD